MIDLLPTILSAALCAMIGGVIGFYIGYALRNPKRKEEHSSQSATKYPVDAASVPTPPKEEPGEPRIFCSAYALFVLLDGSRYDIYRWDDVENIYFNNKEGLLCVRLHGGKEHTYTEWCSYGISPISDVVRELNEDLDED